MTISTKCAALALLVGGCSAITAMAATNVMVDVAARLGYQTSDQKLDGTKVTEWSAPFVGIEGTFRLSPSHLPTLRLEGRGALDFLFDSGKLYADGSGASTDYTARQLRLNGEGDVGLLLGNSDLSLTPFVGLGYRIWSWDNPNPEFLHIESWSAVYGLVGIRGDLQISSARLYGRVAAQLPVTETISVEGFDEDLDYNSTTLVEAELGLVIGKLLLGLWGEWFNYSSDRSSAINYDSGNSSSFNHSFDNSSSLNLTSVTEDITMTAIGVKIGVAF